MKKTFCTLHYDVVIYRSVGFVPLFGNFPCIESYETYWSFLWIGQLHLELTRVTRYVFMMVKMTLGSGTLIQFRSWKPMLHTTFAFMHKRCTCISKLLNVLAVACVHGVGWQTVSRLSSSCMYICLDTYHY